MKVCVQSKRIIWIVLLIANLTACSHAVKLSLPETIKSPIPPEAVDHSYLGGLSLEALQEKYEDYLVRSSHFFQDHANGKEYIQLKLKEAQDKYSNNPKSFRNFLIQELSLENRNVVNELQFTIQNSPIDFAVVVTQQCTLSFNNPDAISKIVDEASTTFAVWSDVDAQSCRTSSGSGCHIYKESCGLIGNIRFEEYPFGARGHFHLGFDDESIGSCYTSEGAGRGEIGDCTNIGIDYTTENRSAYSHDENQTLRLWIEDGDSPAVFSVTRLRIRGRNSADVIVKRIVGRATYWARWDSMTPDYYDFGSHASNIVEMRFKAADGEIGPIVIDDIELRRTIVRTVAIP